MKTFDDPCAETLPQLTASPILTAGMPLMSTELLPVAAFPAWHFFGEQWTP
ncbi:hypothetical protein X805_37960 [Sphaerotilus natans subsp. natans DSM 6575]|uniref:Uncharacterized protein n=1 Tax=Sphaerotilus natans subsp. natans DSM 6575 TaxID=1286631 RepID=A0A059KHM3_9BURK|nr:hypothetical protein X805_37960 [Sphaerotilus natans subsp. natans DSM 6575]